MSDGLSYHQDVVLGLSHPQWKKDRCKFCAAGIPMRGGFRSGHNTPDADPCTAPDPEDYIAELEAAKSENLPEPNTPELKYLAAITERLGVLIEQTAVLVQAFAAGSDPEPEPKRTMKLMDGTEIEY